MMNVAHTWWRLRSLREQRMLMALGGLLALTIIWFGIVRPLDRALSAARERHGRAVIAHGEARARAEALGQVAARPRTPLGEPIARFVERSARDAGFAAARVSSAAPGQAELTIDAARPPTFFGWLDRIGRENGVVVERMDAKANSNATIGVRVTVREGTW